MGRFSGNWLMVFPTTVGLQFSNQQFVCAVRRRLGLVVVAESPMCEGCHSYVDGHGHHRLCCGRTGRTNWRHRGLINVWRQIFFEAGGCIPDRNVERMLRTTNVPVTRYDDRRLDLLAPGLRIFHGRPLFVDVTVVTPISAKGQPRSRRCVT